MTDPARTLGERCDAYLDGDLSREEAAGFERDLAVDPALAAALSAALALRELLAALPPVAPPPGLAARIARALPLREPKAEREGSAAGAVLSGLSWVYRVPAAAVVGTAGTVASAGSGLSHVRWALGPLGALPEPAPRPPPRPLWRRILLGKGKARR